MPPGGGCERWVPPRLWEWQVLAARSGWELLLGAREQRVAARGHGWARGRVLRSWRMQADAALRRLLPGAVLFWC